MATMSSEMISQLAFIEQLEHSVLDQFCVLAVEFIHLGQTHSNKKLAKVADSLGIPVETTIDGIMALAHLFMETARVSMGPVRFATYIGALPLDPERQEEIAKQLYQVHTDKQAGIREILKELRADQPGYESLAWRLDIQLGSRCLRETVEPSFLMRLDTKTDSDRKSYHLEADYANLHNMCEQLEAALAASKGPYYRRVSRAAK
eukprot:TRINITY_DN7657_c0_g1_i3.p1 TRINITY_DN7657_c0_g1~~TRINITY_DN7657_c0_g1_i3.p1  ORF type:complete len:205 (-),score=30.29 TRINITY_DN7657_c0_g1_i3:174-788(-)